VPISDEDRNRVSGGDHTRHPEFAIATVAPGAPVDGPAPELADTMKALYQAKFLA
jgi:hypothetical protein